MNRILTACGILVIIVGGWYVFVREPPPDPLLDARMMPLAVSERQGSCAGTVFWERVRTTGQGSQSAMDDCRKSRTSLSDEFDPPAVLQAFCSAVTAAGYQGGTSDCLQIVRTERLWPLQDGSLTQSWNPPRYPYPGDVYGLPASGDRPARDPIDRDNITRPQQ